MKEAAGAADLSAKDRRRALNRSTLAGSLAMFFIAAAAGPFFTKYILDLGASPAQIGLLGAIPLLLKPLSLLSPALLRRGGSRRIVWYRLALAHRLLWILVIAAPFLASVWGGNPLHVVVATFLVSSLLAILSEPLWISWMGDLCGQEEGATYWPARFSVHGIVGVVASFVMSWVFYDIPQWAPLARLAAARPLLAVYMPFVLVFGLGVACGVVDLWIHARIPDPGERNASSGGRITLPLADRGFVGFCLALGAWMGAMTLIAPFINVFFLEDLEMDFWRISVLGALVQVGALSTSPLWSRLGLRFGQKSALTVSLLGSSLIPVCYLFADSHNALAVVGPAFVAGGILGIGFQSAAMNLLLSLAPPERRTSYVAFYGAVTAAAMGLATLGGGYLVEWLASLDRQVLGLSTGDLRLFFLVSVALRLAVMPAIAGIKAGPEAPTGFVLRQLAFGNPLTLLSGIYAFSRARTPEARARAARWLGRSRSWLATRDLVRALSDGDARVVAEAARGLGRVRDGEGVDALARTLDHPEASVRGSAAWALGRIGTRRALEALLARLENEADEAVRAAAVAAVARIREMEGLRRVVPLLRSSGDAEERTRLALSLSHFAGLERLVQPALDAERRGRGAAVRSVLGRAGSLLRRRLGRVGEGFVVRLRLAADAYRGGDNGFALATMEDVASGIADVLILSKDVLPSPRRWRLRQAGALGAAFLEDSRLGGLLYFIHCLAGAEGEPSDEEVVLAALALERFVKGALRA